MNSFAASRPLFEVTGFRFRFWPIISAIVLATFVMQMMLVPPRDAARWLFSHYIGLFHHQVWAFLCLAELFQMATGVLGVILMRRVLPAADPYLRWPTKASYWVLAAEMGLGFAAFMFVADFWPQLLLKTHFPNLGYEVTPVGILGWLIGSFGVGPNEELIFRGVLVGMLTVLVPGRIRISNFDVPVSAVIVALLFAAAHYQSFLMKPLLMALAQQTYAITWTILYVWLMERSGSIAMPMLAHGLSDASEVAATMIFLTW